MDDINTTVTVGVGLLISMVVGTTELIRRLFKKDYEAAALITASALVGGLGGVFLFEGIGFALGVVTGLGASGVITGLQKFGTGTTVQPSSLSRD